MKELIDQVTKTLGTDRGTAEAATGTLLSQLKAQVGDGAFRTVLDKVPGAGALLAKAGSTGPQGGGLGGMMGAAAQALGGKLGQAGGILGALQAAGLDAAKAPSFVSMFVGFLRQKLGADAVGKLLAKAPDLARLAG